jgi:hypothetical protein
MIIQRAGRRSITIKGEKVTVNGKEVSPGEAEQIKQEGFGKVKQAMNAAGLSPAKGDSVVIVSGSSVTVFGKGVTIRRK